jgi:hypothetical protein
MSEALAFDRGQETGQSQDERVFAALADDIDARLTSQMSVRALVTLIRVRDQLRICAQGSRRRRRRSRLPLAE